MFKKDKKLLVGNPNYLSMKGLLPDIGLSTLIMDLPFGCNQNCLKCYRSANKSIEDLDLNLRKRIISEAKELGAKTIYIAGEGEPLFHKDIIFELLEHINSLNMIPTEYTNATLLDLDSANFFFKNKTSLIMSLDSLNPETYKKLTRGEHSVDEVINNINNARKIFSSSVKKLANGTIQTRLGLITIVQKQNITELENLHEFAGDDLYHIVNFPIKKGNAQTNWEEIVGTELEILKKLSHQYTDTGVGGVSAPRADEKCVALYNGLTIDTNGECLVCPASVLSSVGNIEQNSLQDLWKKTRSYISQAGNPSCIARNVLKSEFYKHDGAIAPHL